MRSIWQCSLFFFFLLLPAYAVAQASLDEITPRIRAEIVTVRSSDRPLRQGEIFDPYYYFFHAALPPGKGSYPLGTGFVLPDGQHIATSYRQLEGATSLEIVSSRGKVYATQLLGADATLDLAILKIKGPKGKLFSGIDFGESRKSRLGDSLLVFGNSLRFMMTKANLSSLDGGEGAYGRHWLIDRPTHPGVAGGPIVDTRGRVVAMAVFNPEGPTDFGTALPAALIIKSSQQLIQSGKITKAWIGIVPKNLASLDDLDHVHGTDIKGGVLIDNLIVDGPAAKAGLQISDFILAIGDKSLIQSADLSEFLEHHKSGETVTIKILRGAKGVMKVQLLLGELPSAQDLPNASQLL
ncbi:MAG: trypsin-like peptidase domain-containing protein [Chitinophagaceae bacterium]|nr:trypsin-like peptidase domain-containing protein [Oligoflexus sp.]